MGSGIAIYNKSVLINYGAQIIKNYTEQNGGAICFINAGVVGASSFISYGGAISNNMAKGNGGAMYLTGVASVVIKGGKLTDNTAYNGGVMYLWNYSTATLSGGEIFNNSASSYGAGVFCADGAKFLMTGGEIFSNSARDGGGVAVNNDYEGGTFRMTGGNIRDNTATNSGGGVFANYNSTFTMFGGEISGNRRKAGCRFIKIKFRKNLLYKLFHCCQ